jgi:hypothetical protein
MLKSQGKKRSLLASFAIVVALTTIISGPAMAITDGVPDGNTHDFVGLMVAQDADGNPLWRCSGTMISSTVFLTAGHCTEAPAAHVEIWFDGDVQSGIPANGYPFTGDVGGTPITHPDYDPNAFFFRDLGVVVLDAPYNPPSNRFGILPGLDSLDQYATKRGQSKVKFRAVGYGLQKSFPTAARWKTQAARVRYVTDGIKLNQINGGIVGDFSLLLSNNAHTGGTCFGDSGGPNFISGTDIVAGVTSFGLNGNCAGTGGVFRMDRSWSLDFVNDYL